MTGFGQSESTRDSVTIKFEIQSLNSRYFDLSLRIGRQLQPFESSIRARAQELLIRGKVTISANIIDGNRSDEMQVVDVEKVRHYRELFDTIGSAAGINEAPTLIHFLSQNDIFSTTEEEVEGDVEDLVTEVFEAALADLIEMRQKEGANLAADLGARLQLIDDEVRQIETLASESRGGEMERYKAKVQELAGGIPFDEDRLLQELAIMAEKRDIAEECTRLMSHNALFREYLSGSQATGKKMGFLLQEMGREINTIGSKTSLLDISHKVVGMKEELERMREQAQNIL